MRGSISLEDRLAGHVPAPRSRRIRREAFAAKHRTGLRARIDRSLEDAVQIFELDRMLYEIEIEAQNEWLRRLMAFDAYCARRDACGLGDDPVR